jgi:FkbM family methyltransferase
MAKFFVEIGAANFDTLLPLAKAGWRGIVVEPTPHLFNQCVEMFLSYDVNVVQAAISDYSGQIDFAVARDDGGWLTGCSHVVADNHLGRKLSDHPLNKDNFNKRITVDCLTLDKLLSDVDSVDFMKVDVEGHENNIFNAYSFRIKPSFLKVEHRHVDDIHLKQTLEKNGYLVWTEKDDIYAIT